MKTRSWLVAIAILIGILGSPGTTNGAVVSINIRSAGSPAQDISGLNAGIINFGDSSRSVSNFVGDATLSIQRRSSRIALDPDPGTNTDFRMATLDGTDASIFRFAKNDPIGPSFTGVWDATDDDVAFYNNNDSDYNAPSFGPDSFIGFRFGNGTDFRYGYIEVLWTWTGDRATSSFEILSAAYEDQLNTPILAGAQPTVPEPTSMAIFGLGVLGMAYRARRKARI